MPKNTTKRNIALLVGGLATASVLGYVGWTYFQKNFSGPRLLVQGQNGTVTIVVPAVGPTLVTFAVSGMSPDDEAAIFITPTIPPSPTNQDVIVTAISTDTNGDGSATLAALGAGGAQGGLSQVPATLFYVAWDLLTNRFSDVVTVNFVAG